MIEIKDLRAGYGKKEILHGVSLDIKNGEILSVVGPNGCGKSTLLKVLAGIIKPVSGMILLDGEKFSALTRKTLAKRIAYLPQDRPIPEMTVAELVLKGRFPHLTFGSGYSSDDFSQAAIAINKLGLEQFSEMSIVELSGGMRQKAYVATALAQEADHILLDEPFTHLDVPHRYALADLMRSLADEGRAVVSVMHELSDALALSDRLAVMDKGNIVFTGYPDELINTDVLPRVFGVRYRKIPYDGKVSFYPERI